MSAAPIRAQYCAVLRAIADAVEADPTLPLPSGHLSTFPKTRDAGTALVRAVPLDWRGETDERHLSLWAEAGEYACSGIRLYVNLRREDAGTESETRTVTVTEFIPDPEITALLEGGER